MKRSEDEEEEEGKMQRRRRKDQKRKRRKRRRKKEEERIVQHETGKRQALSVNRALRSYILSDAGPRVPSLLSLLFSVSDYRMLTLTREVLLLSPGTRSRSVHA